MKSNKKRNLINVFGLSLNINWRRLMMVKYVCKEVNDYWYDIFL